MKPEDAELIVKLKIIPRSERYAENLAVLWDSSGSYIAVRLRNLKAKGYLIPIRIKRRTAYRMLNDKVFYEACEVLGPTHLLVKKAVAWKKSRDKREEAAEKEPTDAEIKSQKSKEADKALGV